MASDQLDVMVDFETLGVSRDSVILSAGIVLFDPKGTGVVEEYYGELDVLSQIAEGRTTSKQTVDWWRATNIDELLRLLCNFDGMSLADLEYAVTSYRNIGHVWSRGYMDFEILQDITMDHFKYWQFRDVRTLDSFGNTKMKSNSHNALEDCKNQVKYVQEVLLLLLCQR